VPQHADGEANVLQQRVHVALDLDLITSRRRV
jgi:hypothetical protein